MANKQRDLAKETRWRDILKRHTASGLSVRAFCQQEQVTEPTFYAWRRTISEQPKHRRRPETCRSISPINCVENVDSSILALCKWQGVNGKESIRNQGKVASATVVLVRGIRPRSLCQIVEAAEQSMPKITLDDLESIFYAVGTQSHKKSKLY